MHELLNHVPSGLPLLPDELPTDFGRGSYCAIAAGPGQEWSAWYSGDVLSEVRRTMEIQISKHGSVPGQFPHTHALFVRQVEDEPGYIVKGATWSMPENTAPELAAPVVEAPPSSEADALAHGASDDAPTSDDRLPEGGQVFGEDGHD